MPNIVKETPKKITVKLTSLQEQTLWQIYFIEPSDQNRNALVEHYYETCCRYMTIAFYRRQDKTSYSKSEAFSDMALRLLRAIPRYDPAKNDNFLAYFLNPSMLRGIILDGTEKCFKQDKQVSEDTAIEGEYCEDVDTEFIDLCESRFEGMSDLEYEIAQALVFEGSGEAALMRQLRVSRAQIKRVRTAILKQA